MPDFYSFRFRHPNAVQAKFNLIASNLGQNVAFNWLISRHWNDGELREEMAEQGFDPSEVARLVNTISGQGDYVAGFSREPLAGYRAEQWLAGQIHPDGTAQPPALPQAPDATTPPLTQTYSLMERVAQLERETADLGRRVAALERR